MICNDIDRKLCAPCRTGQQGRHYSRIHNIPETKEAIAQKSAAVDVEERFGARRTRTRAAIGTAERGEGEVGLASIIIMNVNAVLQPAVQFQHLSQEVRTQNLLQSIKTKEMREPLIAVQNILAQNR